MSKPMSVETHLLNHGHNPGCDSNHCAWHSTWQELSDCWVCRIGMPLSNPNPNTPLTINKN